jgi:cytochrome P450
MATSSAEIAGDDSISKAEREAALLECLTEFTEIWNSRLGDKAEGRHDFITLMANSPAFKDMSPMEYLGNLILLIVGGNDTTRNSISGGIVMLNENPGEYDKLRSKPSLIPSMVSEVIRYQTPLMHMRRIATKDTVLSGQHIKKGDKVVMWYVSGNRDASKIDQADNFIIDRKNARNHISFGFGIHRCMGNRLAEMQLKIVWEEIMNRFSKVEVVGPVIRAKSNFVRGILDLPVVLHAK